MKNKACAVFTGILIFICLLTLPNYIFADADNSKTKAKVSIILIYQSMFADVEKKDFVKIKDTLPYLEDVLTEEKKQFGVDVKTDLENALKSSDANAVKKMITKVVFYDIKHFFWMMLNSSEEKNGQDILIWIKRAEILYNSFIAPDIKKEHFKADWKVRDNFMNLTGLLETKYSKAKADIIKNDSGVLENIRNIESEILNVYPEFKQN